MRIEVYADIACPWCYIGLRRLNAAVARRSQLEVERVWRPFLLQPDLSPEGMPWEELVERKFGGMDRARPMFERVAAEGARDGIDFAFERMSRAAQTAEAHRLVLWAQEQGKSLAMADSLFAGYFSEGRNLNDAADLLGLVENAGLDPAAADIVLQSGRYGDVLTESLQTAARLGIQGVPFYVIDGKYGISGAQPVEYFVQALDQVAAETA